MARRYNKPDKKEESILHISKSSRITKIMAIVLLTALCACLASCRPANNTQESGGKQTALTKAPLLGVSTATSGSPVQRIQALQLTTSWMYVDEKGMGVGYEADSPHALQLHQSDYDAATIRLSGDNNEIELQFSDNHPPESITVQRWDAKFATGNQDIIDVLDKSEPVIINGNMIAIIDDGYDWVYEVYAKWQEGSSYYAFRTETAHMSNEPAQSGFTSFTIDTPFGDTAAVMLPDDFIDFYTVAFSINRTAIIEESAANDARYLAEKTVGNLALLSSDYDAAVLQTGFHVGVMLEKFLIENTLTSIFQINIMPYGGEENYVAVIAYAMFEGTDSKVEIGFDYAMEPDYPVRDVYFAE